MKLENQEELVGTRRGRVWLSQDGFKDHFANTEQNVKKPTSKATFRAYEI